MSFKYGAGEKPLEGYSIRRGLGFGGFGEVYLAVTDAGKEVAIKQVHRNLDVEMRGASQCLNLRHPNLVDLLDIRQTEENSGWIVMEYVAGSSLRERLDASSEGLSREEVLNLFGQLGAGVQYLHEQGIVHRDLKPANIFIENGLVKIGDYGLSKFIAKSQRGGQTESVGTFHYMAPEISNGEYGKEIDIYSTGILLYEMLTGRVPFDGESSQEIILKHLTALPDLSKVPSEFRKSIELAIHKDPRARFASAKDMLQSLGISIDQAGMAVQSTKGGGTKESFLPRWNVFKKRLLSDPLPFVPPQSTPFMVASNNYARMRTLRYAKEPIANAVMGMFAEIQRWFSQIPHNSPWYGSVLAIVIVVAAVQGVVVLPFIISLLVCYIPYYIVWSCVSAYQQPVSNPEHLISTKSLPLAPAETERHSRPAETDHLPSPPKLAEGYGNLSLPKNSKPAFRNFAHWQSSARERMRSRPWVENWREWTWSIVASTSIVTILSIVGYLTAIAVAPSWVDSTHFVAVGTWTAVMVLLTTWTVLFVGKRWERRAEDSLIFRFTQLTIGLGLGTIAFALSDFLQVPWNEVTNMARESTPRTWARFHNGLSPLLPAFMAYFAMLMGLVRWWRQSDILRKHRFSIFSVLWSVLAATIVSGVVYFPTPWCLILAGGTSLALQMSTPWIDFKQERLT